MVEYPLFLTWHSQANQDDLLRTNELVHVDRLFKGLMAEFIAVDALPLVTDTRAEMRCGGGRRTWCAADCEN